MSREVRRGDDGSAVVEYTLVSILVVFLALGVLQLALALHVRNIMIASAHEGARVAALHDRSDADGERRTRKLLADSLGGLTMDVSTKDVIVDGAVAVTVDVSAPIPMFGLWGVGSMTVSARALEEELRGE